MVSSRVQGRVADRSWKWSSDARTAHKRTCDCGVQQKTVVVMVVVPVWNAWLSGGSGKCFSDHNVSTSVTMRFGNTQTRIGTGHRGCVSTERSMSSHRNAEQSEQQAQGRTGTFCRREKAVNSARCALARNSYNQRIPPSVRVETFLCLKHRNVSCLKHRNVSFGSQCSHLKML